MKNESKSMKKYEPILKDICNVGDLNYLRGKEWEGCLGVACVLSYIDGVPANINTMARYLGFSPFKRSLETAFGRLEVNGIFGAKYNAKNDPVLKGENFTTTEYVNKNHLTELAWANIAGIAGGFVGLKEEKINKSLKSE